MSCFKKERWLLFCGRVTEAYGNRLSVPACAVGISAFLFSDNSWRAVEFNSAYGVMVYVVNLSLYKIGGVEVTA